MERSWSYRVRGTRRVWRVAGLLTVAFALAACNPDSQGVSAQQPRGATVAFDFLDGLPPSSIPAPCEESGNDEARVASSCGGFRASNRRRTACAAISLQRSRNIRPRFHGYGYVFDVGRASLLCVSAVRKQQGPAQRRLDRRRRRHAVPDRAIEHGAACCVPDVAGGRAGTAPSAEPQIALVGASDFLPGGCWYIPYFRPQADPISTASAEPSGGG